MAMHRIFCPFCGWATMPRYSIIDCIREKEGVHMITGICSYNEHSGRFDDPHDSAFSNTCPKCGGTTKEVYRYFSDAEIEEAEKHRREQKEIDLRVTKMVIEE